ncbi:unnamed protein product [Moneuplotes crassus]|uniref:Uncharacterized protein n=1 Tax=Euplotes crassus TaxID=5936 RepID=A0AAD1XAT1_EUPCR|nr:unnamed protein product [Moneuplotes crassus]
MPGVDKKKLKAAFRESSIFNKKYAGVLGVEKRIMMKESIRRNRLTSEQRYKMMTPMANPQSSFFKLFGYSNNENKLSPDQLNRTTYIEIFSSNKSSMKKNLNYINYSKGEHDIITNKRLSSAYSSFRSDLHKYEIDKPEFGKSYKKLRNRSPPGMNLPKKHIMKNIRHIKNLSNLTKLKKLSHDEEIAPNGFRVHSKDKSNFVIFKRRSKVGTRRFNEFDSQPRVNTTPQNKEAFAFTRMDPVFTKDESIIFNFIEEKLASALSEDPEEEKKVLMRLDCLKRFYNSKISKISLQIRIKMIQDLVHTFTLLKSKHKPGSLERTQKFEKCETKVTQLSKSFVREPENKLTDHQKQLLKLFENENKEEIEKVLTSILGRQYKQKIQNTQKEDKKSHKRRTSAMIIAKLENQLSKEKKLQKDHEDEISTLKQRIERQSERK